ncbi:hypothetical protein [Tropicibacter sp. Alg240-R139]|uniref:hypothetical protein n=1 Tax=Tropicibacter sp. Alg240-R139 TaxID=2305991 RepID=UPI0013DFB0D3|nr:hypothetical protein [Tropicibacter sp. Alg240-R139]
MLIQLANNFTEGDHKDRETAYRSVEAALVRLKASEHIAQLVGNAAAQFAALMKEVDALNNAGEFDEANDKLTQQADWLREEKERLARLSELQLEKELNQDRLRNRPDLAAERIVRNLREFPKGKLFWAVDNTADDWRDEGDKTGDVFASQVALVLAQGNYAKVNSKKPLAASALHTLGWCHFRLAERSTGEAHLNEARRALEAAVKKASKVKEPKNWAARKSAFGSVLRVTGERYNDARLLRQAMDVQRAALKVNKLTKSADLQGRWNNLGNALQTLGELTKDAETLRAAEEALFEALALTNNEIDSPLWRATQSNLALAKRWLGAVTSDLAELQESRDGYAACEGLAFEMGAPFDWARLQWNIADLALARYYLEPDPALLAEARMHLTRARKFFVEGSDYQTERCDDLLTQIDAAETGS